MTSRWADVQDGDLVLAATTGDADAFAALHDRHAPRIYTRFLYELRDVAEARDATQDTFVDAWRGLHQLRDPQALPAWLSTIADRRAMRARSRRKVHAAALAAGDDDPMVDVPDPTPGPDHAIVQDEARHLVWDAMRSLTPRYQQVLRFKMEHGRAGSDLGAAMGVSPEQASRLADKALHGLAGAVGALVLARTGRQHCSGLDRILGQAGWASGPLTEGQRNKVQRHAGRCPTCGQRRQAVGRTVMASLPAVIPAVVPPDLRARVLEAAESATGPGPASADDPASSSPSSPGGGGVPRWVPAAAVGASVALLGAGFLALRGGGDPDPDGATAGRSEADAGVSADGTEVAPDLDLTGLVVLPSSEGTEVDFLDPVTGQAHTSLDLGVEVDQLEWFWTGNVTESRRFSRQAFSGDWRYAAGTVEGSSDHVSTVWVRQLDPATATYHELLRIDGSGEASYSTEPVEYRNPRFAPDGETLWLESRPADSDEITLVSVHVPTFQEGDEPEPSGLSFEFDPMMSEAHFYPSYDRWLIGEDGEPVLTLPDDGQTIYEPGSEEDLFGNRPVDAIYWTDEDGTVVAARVYLPTTRRAGDPSTCTQVGWSQGDLLLASCADAAVARARVDPDAGTLAMTTVVPLSAGGSPETVVVSPDGTEALLRVEDTWYRASLDDTGAGAGDPQPVEGLGIDLRGMDANSGPLLGWE